MYQVKTLNKIAQVGLDFFDEKYEVIEEGDVDAIILRSYKMHDYPLNKNLRAIARAGAGTNNVPIKKCAQKGIVVFNTPGANANGVKEAVLAGLLLSSRKIVDAITWAKTLEGEGDQVPKLVESGKSNFKGPEIKGKSLGVIGLGAIGVLVANAATSLGMKVIGYDPFISVGHAWSLSSDVIRAKTLEEVYVSADYISLHVPLIKETTDMINETSIQQMKNGVKILNFARGGLVSDQAIAEALETGKVSNYVTDFPNEATLKMKNVIAIPHLGASTAESEENCAVMAVKQLKEYMEHGNIINSVNFPTCDIGKCTTAGRVAIHHKNIPTMVSQITAIFAENNLNVADMINKSRETWAYTMLDVEATITKDMLTTLESIEGVTHVRILK